MKNFTPEMIEKAKAAKSAEELLEVAKAGGIEMTADEAATYFAQLNPKSGELDDDALDGVAGGCGGTEDAYSNTPSRGDRVRVITGQCCPACGSKEGTFFPGDYGLGCGITCDGCKGIYSIDSYKIGVGVELI